MHDERLPSVRFHVEDEKIREELGPLKHLAGTWEGEGFNLIARPDFEGQSNLYLQLNQTRETTSFDIISSAIPNRGFGQDDINLYGLTYLQKISEHFTGAALHIEPGVWATQPATTYPPESAPPGSHLVFRQGAIPHGSSLLAQGIAQHFSGPPTLKTPSAEYAFSEFPSFNSTPFPTLPTAPPILHAAGSSETGSPAAPPALAQYNVSVDNPDRTPARTLPPLPDLPPDINGVPMQVVVNDPITLLQQVIQQQVCDGYSFEGTVLNIATQANITFFANRNSSVGDPTVVVNPPNGAGGIENILFLEGGDPVGPKGANADAALVYATFWIEKVMHPTYPSFMQLQYAQMVILNFQRLTALPNTVNVGWPHVSVATLRKDGF